jgi:hypothetical protein
MRGFEDIPDPLNRLRQSLVVDERVVALGERLDARQRRLEAREVFAVIGRQSRHANNGLESRALKVLDEEPELRKEPEVRVR